MYQIAQIKFHNVVEYTVRWFWIILVYVKMRVLPYDKRSAVKYI